MGLGKGRVALCVLQWSLGVVVLIEAIYFVMPGAAHDFSRTHMHSFVRLLLGGGEILGGILLLISKTAVRGAWILLAVFIMAILLHLLHGMYNVGSLVVYAAAAFALAENK